MNRIQLAAGLPRRRKSTRDRARAGHALLPPMARRVCSEVLVDTLTGEYVVERTDILHDTGCSLNKATDIGQVEGGFIQGWAG